MRGRVFIGIDVACAQRKRLPICFARKDRKRLEPLQVPAELLQQSPPGPGNKEILARHPFKPLAAAVVTWIDRVAEKQNWSISRIAVDAPAAQPSSGERVAERILRQLGLSSFRTPDREAWQRIVRNCRTHLRAGGSLTSLPYANKIWMLYGFELFKALKAKYDVIEVYPYAIVRTLLSECPHKTTEEGYSYQLKAFAAETGWTAIDLSQVLRASVRGSRHDKLDAFMAAWVASLSPHDRCAIGAMSDQNDTIWVPRRGFAQLYK